MKSVSLCLGILALPFLLPHSVRGERVQVVSAAHGGQVPDAEIDAKGTIHVAYVLGEDAFYCQSMDNGKTFSEPLRINAEPKTVHPAHSYRGPDVAIGKGGRVHLIWYSKGYQRKLPNEQWAFFIRILIPGNNRSRRAAI